MQKYFSFRQHSEKIDTDTHHIFVCISRPQGTSAHAKNLVIYHSIRNFMQIRIVSLSRYSCTNTDRQTDTHTHTHRHTNTHTHTHNEEEILR